MLRCGKSSPGRSGCQLPRNGAVQKQELLLHRLRGVGDGNVDSANAAVQIVVDEKSQTTISLRDHERSVEQDALLHELIDGLRFRVSFDRLRDLTDDINAQECRNHEV